MSGGRAEGRDMVENERAGLAARVEGRASHRDRRWAGRTQRDFHHGLLGHGARGAVAAVLVVAIGLLCVMLLLPLTASTSAAVREITLITRDMAFYLEGESEPNPTIQLRAGEEARFTVLNRDPGLTHNLAVEAWGLETRYLKTEASTTVLVRAPARPGRQVYVCVPHEKMMRGIIEVVEDD